MERVVAHVSAAAQRGPTRVIVMVHGFNTTEGAARRQYRVLGEALRQVGGTLKEPMVVVGLTWNSHPGTALKWFPRALGYRLTRELGFKNAVRNPYLAQVPNARNAGRKGLRPLLLSLQERVPGTPVDLFTHSMGGEIALRALAPDALVSLAPLPRVESVVLAGADLDHDVFCQRRDPLAAQALPRAALWWATVPRKNSADAVLELRRGAGRRDALGNIGMELERENLDALLDRRGLVFDDQAVPVGHMIEDYYSLSRMERVLRSLIYMRQPSSTIGQRSILADVDRVLGGESVVRTTGATSVLEVYRQWKRDPSAVSFGPVRVCRPKT